MDNLEILKNIGLSSNEAKVYLAVLKLKKGLITPIAKQAGINRTTAYDILEYLNKKSLVLKYVENGKIGYTTEGPQKIKNWLTEKENRLDKQREVFKQNLEQLKQVFYSKEGRPRFRYFEGLDSVEDFFNDSLECQSGEMVGYNATQITFTSASEKYIKKFAKTRAKRKIKGRYFVQEADRKSSLEYARKFYKKYVQANPDLLKVKILPTREKKHLINETVIYDNKLAISHMGEDFFGVIIEDEAVANRQRMIFEVLWQQNKEELKLV